jgi:hypothetical protein
VDLLCGLRRGPLTEAEKARLRRLARQRDIGSLRIVFFWMRAARELEVSRRFCLALSEQLAHDWRDEVHGGAIYAVERLLTGQPHRLWRATERIAESGSAAVLGTLATHIVEHLLQRDYDRYLPLIERNVRAGDRRWVRILAGCYILGQAAPHEACIHALLKEHSTAAQRTRWVWRTAKPPKRSPAWRDGLFLAMPSWPGWRPPCVCQPAPGGMAPKVRPATHPRGVADCARSGRAGMVAGGGLGFPTASPLETWTAIRSCG